MNPDQNFQQAIHTEIVWKNPEVQNFAVALVKHALELNGQNFTTDIVPDTERGSGTGIAGTVVELLKNAGLVESVGVVQHGVFYQHRMKSTRDGRNSAWLNVYRLKSHGLAQEFLRRNGKIILQAELSLA
jgi:hypothetical protein